MTIKDLQRIVLTSDQSTPEDSPAMKELLKKLKDRPFYIWSKDKHESIQQSPGSEFYGRCCFNDVIGLPKKNGKEQPLWDYQYSIFKALFDPSYINFRAPTEEERKKYDKLLMEAELKSQSRKET